MNPAKKLLFKGTALYLWEELKTMNRSKFKALKNIAKGYFSMKREKKKSKGPRTSIYPSEY